MVSGVGQPVLDYQLATANQSQLLSEFQQTPTYSQAVAYYKANIGSVTTPQDLINNPKLLNVALSAFQLEGEAPDTGVITDLLTQDPTQSTSLAQQLVDPRFTQFASAFASLQTDGGATINNPTSVNAIIAGYTTNEYQKFISNLDNDPTTRQALFFQHTIEDTVDLSDNANLFTQFQQSPAVTQAVSSYQSGIFNVTSVNDLLNNPSVLDVALQAFNINPATISTSTLSTILNESSTAAAADPLLTSNANLASFQQTFSTLATDGGATVQGSSSINTIVTDYQTNQFAQTIAANSADPSNSTTLSSLFGASGATTVSTLLGDFQNNSGISQSISDYQNNIGGVTSVSQLVSNPDLLSVALGAFNIDPTTVSTDVVTQLLTNDPTASATLKQQATSLLENDPNIANFVQAFSSLGTQGAFGSSDFTNINNLFQQYQSLSSVQSATTNYENGIQGVSTVAQLVANTNVLDVALQAFNIDPSSVTPTQIGTLLNETPTQQAADTTLTSNPNLAAFVQTFSTLTSDGGATVQSDASVASIVNAYQANSFAQTLATNDPTTINADFPGQSSAVSTLSDNYLNTSGTQEAIQYYENNIDTVGVVTDLTGNPQLLNVALGAFNIDPNSVTSTQIENLLTETPAQQAADPLVTSNPNIANFVQAFGSLNTDDGASLRSQTSINTIVADYQTNQFQQSIAARTQEVIANPTLANPSPQVGSATSVANITQAFEQNQFQASVASQVQQVQTTPSSASLSIIEFLGNATLSAVTLGALGLPAQTGALDVDQQQQILTNAGFDPNSLLDPTKLKQFISQFLANAQINSGASGSSPADVALAALTNGENSSDGIVPLDLSFLQTPTSGSSSGSSANGSLVNLFT
jgi:hypothetical protein